MINRSIYDLPLTFAKGDDKDLSHFKGKFILIVNVASACGYTGQYKQLQELQDELRETLVVIGCPCNDFGGQEPGSIEEIVDFCSRDYGVDFPLTQKLTIANDPHPLYQWLTHHADNNGMLNVVKWNFHKFLINPEGELIGSFNSGVSPISEEVLALIK